MTERLSGRTPNSKLIELGGRKFRRSISLGAPIHYLDPQGKLQDIDLTARMNAGKFLIDKAPYALRVDPTAPSYRYTASGGGIVAVELIAAGGAPIAPTPAVPDGTEFVWQGVATDTDYRIVPKRFGVAAYTILKSADAPREWSWRIIGTAGLLQPVSGRDAKGQICEIEQETIDGVLTARWTGRVTTQQRLRQDPATAWDAEPVYPVTIDPTVNEAIVAGADDGSTIVYAGTAQNLTYANMGAGYAFGVAAVFLGVRFQTVGIPQGATIDVATLSLDVTKRTGSPSSRIYADDVDDAAAWSAGSRIKNITKTTAFAAFAPPSTGVKTIDVKTVVQEIVSRAGWASNNDMRFAAFDQVGAGSNYFSAAAFEHATRPEAQLDIDYTEGAAAPIVKFMHHYKTMAAA